MTPDKEYRSAVEQYRKRLMFFFETMIPILQGQESLTENDKKILLHLAQSGLQRAQDDPLWLYRKSS